MKIVPFLFAFLEKNAILYNDIDAAPDSGTVLTRVKQERFHFAAGLYCIIYKNFADFQIITILFAHFHWY